MIFVSRSAESSLFLLFKLNLQDILGFIRSLALEVFSINLAEIQSYPSKNVEPNFLESF